MRYNDIRKFFYAFTHMIDAIKKKKSKFNFEVYERALVVAQGVGLTSQKDCSFVAAATVMTAFVLCNKAMSASFTSS